MKRAYRLFVPLLLVPFLLVLSVAAQAAPLKIEYTVAPHPTATGDSTTAVTIRVQGLKGEKSLRVQMAVWSPGDYHVMDHAKFVKNVVAEYEPAASDHVQPEV